MKVDSAPSSLSTLYAQLHPTKNSGLDQNSLRPTHKVVCWWLCPVCQHEWEAQINSRWRGVNKPIKGCPRCRNAHKARYPQVGESLVDKYPKLASEWLKSNSEPAERLYPNSTLTGLWKCSECDTQWEATPNYRVRRPKCPHCTKNHLTISNDCQKWTTVDLTQYNTASKETILWVCPECNYYWKQRICSFVKNPKCANPAISPKTHQSITARQVFKSIPESLLTALTSEWSPLNPKPLKEFSFGSAYKATWVCSQCNHIWDAHIYARTAGSQCPKCAMLISQPEEELNEFFSSRGLTFERNTRKVIAPFELDFYFPGENIAIEYNGLLWHSEKFKPNRNYHYEKWKACADLGIQLIMVWEDDWLNKPELVKTMLAHKLGVSNQRKVYARKTVIDECVARGESGGFLDANHIQGAATGSKHIGLRENGKLVALGVFKRKKNCWSLERYASSAQVLGGLGRILSKVQEPVSTFADRSVSNGDLYTRLGFEPVKILPPDYSYLYSGRRVHKFNFRLKRFEQDAELQFVEGLTERELAELNGLLRIWDCGKVQYVRP